MEPISANLVVECSKLSDRDVCAIIRVSKTHHRLNSVRSLIYVLLKCLDQLFKGPYMTVAFSVELLLKNLF